MKVLRLILGDQLNEHHSWFKEIDPAVTYLMVEARSETDYARHHIQKVVAFFLAMRSFAENLRSAGHKVVYFPLDAPENKGSISRVILYQLEKDAFDRFEYLLPDEYRLDSALKELCEKLEMPTAAFDTEHFLIERSGVEALFEGKRQYLMETFYRAMRRKYQVLMEADETTPLGGRWNFDQENRKNFPAKHPLPEQCYFKRDVSAMVDLVKKEGVETIGTIDPEQFIWPVSREEGLQLLDHFCRHLLPEFGTYQDAMTERDRLLFHSRLSFLMNVKLLHPLEVVNGVVAYWEEHQEEIELPQVEGFVRQIIGWREFMRGIYWAKMPDYAEMNFFDHQEALPAWYWTGKTRMNCLSHAIGQSLELAYAHHIQRLMVTGNFALLLGVHPDAVDAWYLGIYIDAIQWVEITNTRGMSQFADGGIVGTKPYVSSANYIHKMSDYCKNCSYNRKKKYGEGACPFNSLYWDFIQRHEERLAKNPRMAMMYRTWNKMDDETKEGLLRQAEIYKKQADQL